MPKPMTDEQVCKIDIKQGLADAAVLKEAVGVMKQMAAHPIAGEKELGVLAKAQQIIHKNVGDDAALSSADKALQNAVKDHDFSGIKGALATVQHEANASERSANTAMRACMGSKAEGQRR